MVKKYLQKFGESRKMEEIQCYVLSLSGKQGYIEERGTVS
jgi:hypothetical protein